MKKDKEEILYEEVFRAFNKTGIDYAVCGGLAVVLHGYIRFTADLDLIVGLGKNNLEKIYDVLERLDYKLRVPIKREEFIDKKIMDKLSVEKNMKVVSFFNLKDNFKIVDIGINLPDNEEILKRKQYIKIDGFSIPIISIDDLIKMKEEAGRSRDLTDVENLKEIKKEKRR